MSQEKNADLQKQLSMTLYSGKHKSQKINDRKDSDSTSVMVSQESPGIGASKGKVLIGGVPVFSFSHKWNTSEMKPASVCHYTQSNMSR